MFLLWLLGLLSVLAFLYHVVTHLQLAFGVPLRSLQSYTNNIVISGVTDGIGRQLALIIAHSHPKAKLILLGRNQNKLDGVSHEIKSILKFEGSLKTVCLDFAEGTAESQFKQLEGKLGHVDILINNCGQGYPGPQTYDVVSDKFLNRLVSVNLQSTFVLTRLCLPLMKAANKGIIVCTGSATRVACEPYATGYATTKGGIAAFCQSLHSELQNTNILVQCQEPAWVRTAMSKPYHDYAPGMVTDYQCAHYMIRAMERAVKNITPCVFSPHPLHGVQVWFVSMLPAATREAYRRKSRSKGSAL